MKTNRRGFIKATAVVLASLPFVGQFVKPTAVVRAATREFTDEEPYGFQPPSVTCWRPGQGAPPWGHSEE
jgi:hypothetical protein